MKDFWLSCGHHLLDRDEGGGLVVTDEFIKVYFARPELAPPADACAAERALHESLLRAPRRTVAREEIATIADADARENWEVMIAFRDHLMRHPTLEAAYLALVRGGVGRTPPLFFHQLIHVILRNVLDGCDDPFVLRAAELFFRPQRMTVHEGALIAADEETVNGANPGPVSPLVAMLGLEAGPEIDVLNEGNAETYWERSDRFDMALDLTAGRRGHAALAEVIARWTRHLLHAELTVEPLVAVQDAPLPWYVGLDVHGTRLGDRLWHGEALDDAAQEAVVALFKAGAAAAIEGEGFLILAMSPDRLLRMKPQNLITGLPLQAKEAVS